MRMGLSVGQGIRFRGDEATAGSGIHRAGVHLAFSSPHFTANGMFLDREISTYFSRGAMVVRVKGKPNVDRQLKEGDVLWRYLDAAKFLDLIHNRSLFFVRGDQFADKFEGAFTESIKKAIDVAYEKNKIEFSSEEFKTRLRERVFLNSWHRSTDDSMAMWRIYGRSEKSLAITTTVEQLRNAIAAAKPPYYISLTKVKYVKHWRDPEIIFKPYSNIFAYKVKAYEFEKEVRVIIERFDDDFDYTIQNKGISIQIDLGELLRSIVISPEAPPWLLELIKGVAKKYGVAAPVRRSKLSSDPL